MRDDTGLYHTTTGTGGPPYNSVQFDAPAHAIGLAPLRVYSQNGTNDNGIYTGTNLLSYDNRPPIAIIYVEGGWPTALKVGRVYVLEGNRSGSASYDPEAEYTPSCTPSGIDTYEWKVEVAPNSSSYFSAPSPHSTDLTFNFTPDAYGEYKIELKVKDTGLPDPEYGTATVPSTGTTRTLPQWKEIRP